MTNKIVFVHGMFQNPKSWDQWVQHFKSIGFDATAIAWPFHEGEPATLRANPPAGLGDLRLKTVIDKITASIGTSKPILVGHSVGGLVAQILLNRGLLSAAVAISSVAPNGIIDFDFSSLKNIATIINPLKGDDPFVMDAETFHAAFANTLTEAAAKTEYARTATNDSRNVLRDCMGSEGKIDIKMPHAPLLLIGGDEDQICPQHLTEKNAHAYEDSSGSLTHKAFPGRSHYICNEPGWEEVCTFVSAWITKNVTTGGSFANKLSAA